LSYRRESVFYGWWVVLTAALGLFLGAASIIPFSFGVFLPPLSREFHAGRATIALASSFFNLALAISSPLIGQLVDHYGSRRIILTCTVAFGVILLFSKIASSTVWQLYIFYSALGFVAGGAVPVPYGKVVSHWFDRRRGLALGLMMCGTSFGTIVMPSISQRLIALFGWRTAYGIIGAAVLLIPVPAVGIFLKEKPEEMGLLPDGAPHIQTMVSVAQTDQDLSWHDTWHSGTFWLILSAFFLVGASIHGCFICQRCLPTEERRHGQRPWLVRFSVEGS
jgi:MFS family permease